MVHRNKCPHVNNVTDTSGTSVLIQDPTANRCFIFNPYKMWTCMTILSNLKRTFCTIIQTCVKTIPWKTFNFRNKNLHHEFDDIIKSSRYLALKKKQPTYKKSDRKRTTFTKFGNLKNYLRLFILKNKMCYLGERKYMFPDKMISCSTRGNLTLIVDW